MEAPEIIRILGPLLVLCPFAVGSQSVRAAKTQEIKFDARLCSITRSAEFAIPFLFACEVGLNTYEILNSRPLVGSERAIYTVSGFLVSLLLCTRLSKAQPIMRYPNRFVWLLALLVNTYISAHSIYLRRPLLPREYLRFILQTARCLAVVSLLICSGHTKNGRQPFHLWVGQGKRSTGKAREVEDSDISTKSNESDSWLARLKQFRVFIPVLRHAPWRMLVIAIVFDGVGQAFSIAMPFQFQAVLDNAAYRRMKEAFFQLIFGKLMGILSSLVPRLSQFFWEKFHSKTIKILEIAVHDRIMELGWDFHSQQPNTGLYAIQAQCVYPVRLFRNIFQDVFFPVMNVFAISVYLYLEFGTSMLFLAASTLGLYMWTVHSWMETMENLQRRRFLSYQRRRDVLHNTLGSWVTAWLFHNIPYAQQQHRELVHDFYNAQDDIQQSEKWQEAVKNLLLDLSSIAASLVGFYHIWFSGQTVGALLTLMTYWDRFLSSLPAVSSLQSSFLETFINAQEVMSVMAQPVMWDKPPKPRIEKGCVAFQNVSLVRKNGKPIVKNLSFRVESGELVALVGLSGSGKSTILNLVNGLCVATEGRIIVDGKDLRRVSTEDIGTVSQEVQLINGTIRENIGYAQLTATSLQIEEACKAAAFHEKIMSFADQYDTRIGLDGHRLSGGERQRIGLARLFLMEPRIILLDEATSSLDVETEAKVLLSLESLRKGRTTIMVSHRLATIRKANTILLIESGTILERGTHDELMKAGGKYYELWRQQTGIAGNQEQAGREQQCGEGEETSEKREAE